MIQKRIQIGNIPVIIYGSASEKLFLYVHGKHSSKEEAEYFAPIVERSGYQMVSFDLPEHGERKKESYRLFLSPILDMERLIQNMMKWSNISEDELKEKGEYHTSFGETLSWDYYEYVRNNPVMKWVSPTFILYGENDNLTERGVLDSFAQNNNCDVTIMPNGEHYFHTKEQLDYLENWLQKVNE